MQATKEDVKLKQNRTVMKEGISKVHNLNGCSTCCSRWYLENHLQVPLGYFPGTFR